MASSPTPMATDNDISPTSCSIRDGKAATASNRSHQHQSSAAASAAGITNTNTTISSAATDEKKTSVSSSIGGPIDLDDDEDGVLFESHGGNVADDRFDQMIGVLEDYILDASFGTLQNDFFRAHMAIFVDDDENKLEYTPVHQKYVDMLEAALSARLTRDVPNFDMTDFLTMIEDRKDEIPGDIMDILSSLDDFEMFKSIILSFKRENTASVSSSIAVHHLVGPSTTSATPSSSSGAPAKSSSASSAAVSNGGMTGFGISGTSLSRTPVPLSRPSAKTAASSSSSSRNGSAGLGLDFGISGTAIRKK